MKFLTYLIIGSAVVNFCIGASVVSEKNLVDLMIKKLDVLEVVEGLDLSKISENELDLKPIEAFGLRFLGQAVVMEGSCEALTYWCDEQNLLPDVALRLFTQITNAFSQRIGEGKVVNDVPSFEDASETKTQVRLWPIGNEMIVVTVTAYPTRAGLSLQRIIRSAWIEQMGADQGKFWNETLKTNGIVEPAPEPQLTPPLTPTTKERKSMEKKLKHLMQSPNKISDSGAKTTAQRPVFTTSVWLSWFAGIVGVTVLFSLAWQCIKRQK